jgi:hypothetical protein
MTPERLAEIQAMLDRDNAMFFYGDEDWQDPRFMDDANPIIRELLAEIDRLNEYQRKLVACVSMVGPWPQVYDTLYCNNCWSVLPNHEPECIGVTIADLLHRVQHDPTQPQHDEQHEPVQQAVPPPRMV